MYYWLRSKTLVTEKISLHPKRAFLKTARGTFSLGRGRLREQGSRDGKGNRTELGDLRLDVHGAHKLVAGDQL